MNDPAIKIDLWKNKDVYYGSNNKVINYVMIYATILKKGFCFHNPSPSPSKSKSKVQFQNPSQDSKSSSSLSASEESKSKV